MLTMPERARRALCRLARPLARPGPQCSSVAAGLPTFLLQARYSRTHELEADAYGAAMLKANGIAPKRLADMLAKLEVSHRDTSKDQRDNKNEIPPQAEAKRESRSDIGDYLASHPATRERIDALNGIK